jgi:hypothetical protein
MGKLFDKPATPPGDGADGTAASRKPSPIMQGLGAGVTNGLNALDQSRQTIANRSQSAPNISVPGTPAQIVQPNLDYPAAAPKRLAPSGNFRKCRNRKS